MTPTCNFVARKVRPNTDLTFRICVPYNARPPLNLQHGKWLHHVGSFLLTQLEV